MYSRISVLFCVFSLAACEDEAAPEPVTSTLEAHLALDAPVHDVATIRFKVVAAGDDCDGDAVAEAVVPLEAEALPVDLAGGGDQHPFADALFVLEPGDYRVCVFPQDADGNPSEACMPAEGDASVVADETTEIVIFAQCEGDPSGALDVVGALNDPPHIDDLEIDPSKFVDTCERPHITVHASDPNGDPLEYAWGILAMPAGAAVALAEDGAWAIFSTDTPGEYELEVVVSDGHGGEARLSFPIHVSPCDEDGGACGVSEVLLCDEGWAANPGQPEHPGICGVPDDEETSYWFDFDAGRKVAPGDQTADISKGHVDCCSWNVQNGAVQVETADPSAAFDRVECAAADGRAYGPGAVDHFRPNQVVICLRTAEGNYFKYVAAFGCCGDNSLSWDRGECFDDRNIGRDCDDPVACETGLPGMCAQGAQCPGGFCIPADGPLPEVCDDGLDNDCDGATDCEDPDCAQACGSPDPEEDCLAACERIGACAGDPMLCPALDPADIGGLMPQCIELCEAQPGLAELALDQPDCESLINLAIAASPDFAVACGAP